ncbi:MAG: hypothetical protein ACRD8W_05245 [Nitrososphaeraceae archaeon]
MTIDVNYYRVIDKDLTRQLITYTTGSDSTRVEIDSQAESVVIIW